MSFFQRLFIGTDRTFADVIEVDAVIYENYGLSSQVTAHPIDFAAEVSDHIINNPRLYTIEAVTTDTPMGLLQALQTIGNNARNALNALSSAIIGEDLVAPATARSVAAFMSLVALWESKAVINMQTGMGLWEDMAILDIQVRVDKETANCLRFTATLRHVRRVRSQVLGGEELAEGPVQQSGEPVKREGLKQVVTNAAMSTRDAAARFFQ